jgi:hypothetical protein
MGRGDFSFNPAKVGAQDKLLAITSSPLRGEDRGEGLFEFWICLGFRIWDLEFIN